MDYQRDICTGKRNGSHQREFSDKLPLSSCEEMRKKRKETKKKSKHRYEILLRNPRALLVTVNGGMGGKREKKKKVCESFEEEMVEKRAVKAESKRLPRQRLCHVRRFMKTTSLFAHSPAALRGFLAADLNLALNFN